MLRPSPSSRLKANVAPHIRPLQHCQAPAGGLQITVQGDTDRAASRERRWRLLKNILWSLFERKDERRGFTGGQRRLLWNASEKPLCARCHRPLRWEDFTIDHIKAWARGGDTSLRNAQLMHRACNSSKGMR